jgi:LPXTG-motif cell wall-anchored protein
MNKIGCMLLILVIAFSTMGLGFASSNLSTANVQASTVSWGILGDTLSQSDLGVDQTCDPGLKNPRTEGKDVGATDLEIIDGSRDGVIDKLRINVSNAYPSYYNRINLGIKNFGEIAVKGHKAVISWEGKTAVLNEGLICYLHKNGKLIQGVDNLGDAVMEIRWNGSGDDIHLPGKVVDGKLEFHVLPAAVQNHSYCFDVTLAAEAADVVDSIISEEVEDTGGSKDAVAGIAELPKTGGSTVYFYLTGAVLIIIGAVLRKR